MQEAVVQIYSNTICLTSGRATHAKSKSFFDKSNRPSLENLIQNAKTNHLIKKMNLTEIFIEK